MTLRKQLSYCEPTRIPVLACSVLQARFFSGLKLLLYFHWFHWIWTNFHQVEICYLHLYQILCVAVHIKTVTINKRLLYFQAARSKKKKKAVVLNLMHSCIHAEVKLYIIDGSYTHPWPSLEKARTTAGINLCSVSIRGCVDLQQLRASSCLNWERVPQWCSVSTVNVFLNWCHWCCLNDDMIPSLDHLLPCLCNASALNLANQDVSYLLHLI